MTLNLPDKWAKLELGDSNFFEIRKGSTITKRDVSEGKIPVIAGGQQPAYYHDKGNRNGETITVSGSGAYAGYVNYFKTPIFASDCSTIQSKSALISTQYVYLFLKSRQMELYQLQKGIAQPHVYPKDLVNLKIPVPIKDTKPDIQKQKRIVSILESASDLLEARKKSDELTNNYLKAVFYDMFFNKNYESKSLKEISIKITDGTHKTPRYTNDGVPFFRVTDLTNSNDSKKFISLAEHRELIKRCKPEKDDILYSKNGTIGIAKVVDWDYEFSIFVSLCLIKPNTKLVLPKYLECFLNTPIALNQALRHSKTGTITNLHLNQLEKITVPIPPISLQQNFVNIAKKVKYLQTKQENSKNEIMSFFNSLAQNAFIGGLI